MNKNSIYISGSIGLTILYNKELDKKVYLFYDDHSNNQYCQQNDIYLTNLFDYFLSTKKNIVFLLEEPFVYMNQNIKNTLNNQKYTLLWDDSIHIIKAKKFYTNVIEKCSNILICKCFPTDIRLCLIDLSIETMINNINDESYFNDFNINVLYYFRNYLFLFDIIKNINLDFDKNIIFIKKLFNIFKNTNYYIQLKNRINNFYIKFIKPNKRMLIKNFLKKYKTEFYIYQKGYPFKNINEENMLDQYDKMINAIMDFYIIVLTNYLQQNIIVINCGYYHCNNIEYILKEYYNYNIIYQIGVTDNIEYIDSNNNCLLIDKKYL
jgi:hypothetical protein